MIGSPRMHANTSCGQGLTGTQSSCPHCPLWMSPQPSWSWTFLRLQRTPTIAWRLTSSRLNPTQTAECAPPGISWSSLPGMFMCQTPHTGMEWKNVFLEFGGFIAELLVDRLEAGIINCCFKAITELIKYWPVMFLVIEAYLVWLTHGLTFPLTFSNVRQKVKFSKLSYASWARCTLALNKRRKP